MNGRKYTASKNNLLSRSYLMSKKDKKFKPFFVYSKRDVLGKTQSWAWKTRARGCRSGHAGRVLGDALLWSTSSIKCRLKELVPQVEI